ncbi:Na+/H+ antiporter NhaA, partial [Campylobacter coli]
KLASLPQNANLKQLYGVCILTGIGFTMSLFIDGLAYEVSDIFIVKAFLEKEGHNILNHYINENEIRIYVQTENGLEELIINDDLF